MFSEKKEKKRLVYLRSFLWPQYTHRSNQYLSHTKTTIKEGSPDHKYGKEGVNHVYKNKHPSNKKQLKSTNYFLSLLMLRKTTLIMG